MILCKLYYKTNPARPRLQEREKQPYKAGVVRLQGIVDSGSGTSRLGRSRVKRMAEGTWMGGLQNGHSFVITTTHISPICISYNQPFIIGNYCVFESENIKAVYLLV